MLTATLPQAPGAVKSFSPPASVAAATNLLEEADPFWPAMPLTVEELDVSRLFLGALVLKAVALEPATSTAQVADRLHLGMMITDSLLQQLTRDRLVEIKGVISAHNHRYQMLERGWQEVARIQSVNSYCGPAPVSLEAYRQRLVQQVRARLPVSRAELDVAMEGLVLNEGVRHTLGLVASSGRSLFLSGPSGNGKTAMARALVKAIRGDLWIPYAIEVDGEVIRLFDPHTHQRAAVASEDYDRRWVKIRPPLVMVGGELTIESMELVSSPVQRFYEAPFQLKSNGGVLVVDDLGRQRCAPAALLNRWIIPLENRVDYLTLSTGKKIEVPFEQVVVFATNLTVSDLADEAFLRRMGYRIYVMPPSPQTYAEIFVRVAAQRGLSVSPNVLAHLELRYGREGREPKSCEPRDLIERAIEVCHFNREPVRLTVETLDAAWDSYFGAVAAG
jgi:predicted ATPase with chaperone activity